MEGLAPPLKCIIEIRAALQNGETARSGLLRYIESCESGVHRTDCSFIHDIRQFLFAWDQGRDWQLVIRGLRSPYRRALLEIVATGFAGQSIQPHLIELQQEIETAVDLEIRNHLELLPVQMLIPLLIFQFPAFLILLFGPLLKKLIEEMSR